MCIQYTPLRQPAPRREQAVLALIGQVHAPRVWSLNDLHTLPSTSRRLTLVCSDVALRPKRWDTREWSGVPFSALMREAGVAESAQSVQVAGYDGEQYTFALADLDEALLALEADGQPLSAAQGFPARLLIPGQRACQMPRFVQRMAWSDAPAPMLAPPAPLAVIERVVTADRSVRLEGQALGADSVHVRLDDGPPAAVPVTGGAFDLAGHWSLDWPGADARQATFSVEPLAAQHTALAGAARPLARRWKPQRHEWAPVRSRQP
jgi:DMSO/TMAO reductase YedYZ molybdopterin-dependent catalytic subunit